MRGFLPGICLALVLVVSAHASSGSGQDSGNSGESDGAALQAWRDVLVQPWQVGGEPVLLEMTDGTRRVEVDRCSRLFEAQADGMEGIGPDRPILDGRRIQCEAARLVVGGAVARKDFVAGFTLDEKTVRALPVDLAPVISRDDERKVAGIRSRGGALGDFLGAATVEVLGRPEDRKVVVRDGDGGNQILSVLAEGDFDHDGFNDLLMSSMKSLDGGSYHAADLHVVSRLGEGEPLVVRVPGKARLQ